MSFQVTPYSTKLSRFVWRKEDFSCFMTHKNIFLVLNVEILDLIYLRNIPKVFSILCVKIFFQASMCKSAIWPYKVRANTHKISVVFVLIYEPPLRTQISVLVEVNCYSCLYFISFAEPVTPFSKTRTGFDDQLDICCRKNLSN